MSATPPHGHYLSAAYPHEQENVVTQPVPAKSTPEPVVKAAALYGTGAAFVLTAVGVLVTFGVLSDAEAAVITSSLDALGSQIVPVGVALVGVVSLVSSIVSNMVGAFAARRRVVPTDSDAFTVVPKPPVV